MSNADFDTRNTSPGTRPTTAKPAENGRKRRPSAARSAQPQEIAQRDTPNTTTRHHPRQPKTPVSTGDSLSVQPAPRVPSKELHPLLLWCLQHPETWLARNASSSAVKLSWSPCALSARSRSIPNRGEFTYGRRSGTGHAHVTRTVNARSGPPPSDCDRSGRPTEHAAAVADRMGSRVEPVEPSGRNRDLETALDPRAGALARSSSTCGS